MTLNFLPKLGCAIFTLLAAHGAHAATPWCTSGKPIKMAGITWESGQFYSELVRTVLDKGYGCKTEVVTGSTAATETALVGNDLQLWTEQWGGRTEIIKKGVAAGKVKLVGDLLKGGTVEGWFVPEFVVKGDAKRNIKATAPELKSVSDLPKYKDLFRDDEEPGKGRFLNCPTGWDCERNNNQKIKAYKLGDSFTNFRPGTGAALDAAITSAVERGKPLLFYYWAPAALLGKYRFVQLQEPAYTEACWKTLFNSTSDTPCGSATPPTQLSIGVSTPFADSDPDIVAFLEKVQLSADQINGNIAKMTERKVSAEVVAKEFMKAHPDVWKKWVPADVAAKVSASLK